MPESLDVLLVCSAITKAWPSSSLGLRSRYVVEKGAEFSVPLLFLANDPNSRHKHGRRFERVCVECEFALDLDRAQLPCTKLMLDRLLSPGALVPE